MSKNLGLKHDETISSRLSGQFSQRGRSKDHIKLNDNSSVTIGAQHSQHQDSLKIRQRLMSDNLLKSKFPPQQPKKKEEEVENYRSINYVKLSHDKRK